MKVKLYTLAVTVALVASVAFAMVRGGIHNG